MILRAGARYPLRVGGGVLVGTVDAGAGLGLVWPPWYPASSEDRARHASTLLALAQAGKLDPDIVDRWLTADWGGVGTAGAEDGGAGAGL